jgi:hypothetical protein
VTGRAGAEDAADAGAFGPNPAANTRRAAYPAWRQEAATFADRFGWIPTLRNFVELVANQADMTSGVPRRPETDPDVTPSRVARALAHLLDLPEPVVVPR